MSDQPGVRLSKVMSERGLCSRREADDLIARGLVKVNGEVVSQLGTRIAQDAEIEIVGRAKQELLDKVTILVNKPIGYVSSQPEDGYKAAVELILSVNRDPAEPRALDSIKHTRGLATAGRLDIDSQGLLVFTQDGVIAKKLIGENSEIEKEYIVRVEGRLSKDNLNLLNRGGLVIEGRKLRPAKVEWINDDQLRFILKEGMKRQIRKMCEHCGLRVTGLKRVRIGNVVLGKLPEGNWRFLREDESF
jgi:23S rRNA pseudouridine2604 synthase